MRIVIDLQGAQGASRDRGIGRYSLGFALSVARNRKDHDVIIVLNGMFPKTVDLIREQFAEILPAENIRVWHGISPATGYNSSDRSRREISKILREVFLASLKPDIVHITSLFEGFGDDAVHSLDSRRTYLVSSTLHDLIPLNNSEVYLDNNPTYKTFYLNLVAELMNVDLHLSNSIFSRLELINTLEVDPEKVINVYTGVDEIFKRLDISEQDTASLAARLGITKPFLMYSGASDERKNHLRLIEAFGMSPFNEAYQLVLVGRVPPDTKQRFTEHAALCGLNDDQLIITDSVSDEELVTLYNCCSLFVFPAWQEGFGLPVVEAMRCGAPVIGSNTASIPEVIGNPEALFDPFDVLSIRDAIDAALGNPEFRETLVEHGIKRAAYFSWDRVGISALKAFESAICREHEARRSCSSSVLSSAYDDEVSRDPRARAIERVRSYLLERCPDPTQFAPITWQNLFPPVHRSELITISKSIALNNPQRVIKHLFVDVSELIKHDARTGIQRVVRSVLNELMQLPTKDFEVQPVYATKEINGGYRYARTFMNQLFGGLYTPLPDDLIDVQQGDIFIGLDLQHDVVLAQESFYEEFRICGVEVYFIVYDLLPVLLPEKFPEGAEAAHYKWLTAISKSNGLICISRSVADELKTWLDQHGAARQRPLKIGWFHLGADLRQSLPSKGSGGHFPVLNMQTKVPTFLMVGTLEPRKGHLQTISAFSKLWAAGHDVNLIIVGKQGWNVDELIVTIKRSREFGGRLQWLPAATDDYLETLYGNADCLIAASEGEGFGLPLVEAAQHRIPIFARALPVFREVAGDAAFYFDGLDADSMAHALAEWLGLFSERKIPASANMPIVTWKQSTLQLMNTVINNQWYTLWSGADGWRYQASDPALATIVGIRVGQELHTSGQPGFFLFGPYVTISSGKYRFRLYGSYDGSGKVSYDVVGDNGMIVETSTIKKQRRWGKLLSVNFEVHEETRRCETRIKVDKLANLVLSRVEIFPILQEND